MKKGNSSLFAAAIVLVFASLILIWLGQSYDLVHPFGSESCSISVSSISAVISCSSDSNSGGASTSFEQFRLDGYSNGVSKSVDVPMSETLCSQYGQKWNDNLQGSFANTCHFSDLSVLKNVASGVVTHTASYNGQVEPCGYEFPLGFGCGRFTGWADTSNSQTISLVATFKNPLLGQPVVSVPVQPPVQPVVPINPSAPVQQGFINSIFSAIQSFFDWLNSGFKSIMGW